MAVDRSLLFVFRLLAVGHEHLDQRREFLMVFLIQNSQNRDSSAIQAKLDELIRTSSARNTLVGIEKLTREEIETIRQHIERLAARTVRGDPPHAQG